MLAVISEDCPHTTCMVKHRYPSHNSDLDAESEKITVYESPTVKEYKFGGDIISDKITFSES